MPDDEGGFGSDGELEQDITDICNERHEDYPDEELYKWVVTRDTGSEFVAIGSPEAMIECQEQLLGINRIRPLNENDKIAIALDYEQKLPKRRYEGEHRYEGRARTRDPESRGQHETAEIHSLNKARMHPPRDYNSATGTGEPLLPFGYESPEPVQHLPRHRKSRRRFFRPKEDREPPPL